MASAVTDNSLPSRKRSADDWEDYEEENSITAKNRALALQYGSCSSTSSISNSSFSTSTKKPDNKKARKQTTIVRDNRHNFYGINAPSTRVDSSVVTLIPSKSTSWVWDHFHKFNILTHPDKKGVVSCNICRLAAESDKSINFTVEYKVQITQRRNSSNCIP